MQLLDGKALRDKIILSLKEEVSNLGKKPKLAIVLIGEDEPSLRYIKQKQKAAEEIGAEAELLQFTESFAQEEIIYQIKNLNRDNSITGIIVQLPLPNKISKQKVLASIDPKKDIDGLTPGSEFQPATPLGIMELLNEYKVEVKDKTAVVIGQSDLVGAPLSKNFEEKGAKVIRVDINTPKPIDPLVQQGDIVVSAVGQIGLVTAEMVKEGAVVIDVGTNVTPEGKLVGDVDFENVSKKASFITPVPGGVGPMTVASLMKNLVKAS
ncbi:MAG TPA: bifunctional 5,10-methylenetetrahydrofolate dehydrogenase/5,10-methenyltetrahydrofolate cyclohydrolase [Candidatus Saccharimonadales bacterium]|nr:bifunctional 5,10-methylenetetrahydrofolate dehydrogenase/5,10-methenyltetrahydrofolate cyclohydrolase [Candidatus Saccharimonadales bacterium]